MTQMQIADVAQGFGADGVILAMLIEISHPVDGRVSAAVIPRPWAGTGC